MTAWRRERLFGAVLGVLAVLPAFLWLWGYTVDDALITARVAWRLAQGQGHRFNPSGPVVDAVTPLGFEVLLAPFAREGPWPALNAARALGALSGLLAVGLLGALLQATSAGARRSAGLVMLGLGAPLAAWSVSGMETGWVTLAATAALFPTRWAPLGAGMAAAWRPELLPWALVLAVALPAGRARLPAVLLTLVPALLVAVIRQLAFQRALPLSLLAKPSDLGHGLRYALGGALLTGPYWLLLPPWGSPPRRAKALALASLAHLGALVLAGGDWMSLFRLFVPVLPTALLAGVELGVGRHWSWWAAKWLGGAVAAGVLSWHLGPVAREVAPRRARLIQAGAPLLTGATRVAAVDVGWVGAAFPGEVLDLAGVTDPRVAALPGDHTGKRLPTDFAPLRGVDRWVALLAPGEALREPWWQSVFYYEVDARLAGHWRARDVRARGRLALEGSQQEYVVFELGGGAARDRE